MSKTVLFPTVQFRIQKQLHFKQFSLGYVRSLIVKKIFYEQFSLASVRGFILFDAWMGPYQILPLWYRVDLGAMSMKKYSAFHNVFLDPHHQI